MFICLFDDLSLELNWLRGTVTNARKMFREKSFLGKKISSDSVIWMEKRAQVNSQIQCSRRGSRDEQPERSENKILLTKCKNLQNFHSKLAISFKNVPKNSQIITENTKKIQKI